MTITIALAGDMMLGRGVGAEIDAVGAGELICGEIRDLIRSADLAVVNLECCISSRGQPFPGQRFPFRAPPKAAAVLADLGVRCVTLANNHTADFGPLALADTVGHLAAAGIGATGAGQSVTHARAPAMLAAGGLTIAVLGVTDHPAEYAATAEHPGVAYADLRSGVPDWLTDQVRRAAARADVVLVSPHWGQKMTVRPQPSATTRWGGGHQRHRRAALLPRCVGHPQAARHGVVGEDVHLYLKGGRRPGFPAHLIITLDPGARHADDRFGNHRLDAS